MAEVVRRWRDGDVLWAENGFVTMAYVVTDKLRDVGTLGVHGDLFVEYISAQQAKLWDAV